MIDPFNYKRRKSSLVFVGNTPMGGDNPIRIQSMTNTSTMDTDACVQQAIRIIEAGGEYVRLTAQGVCEAENLANIKKALVDLGYNTPLIADIHFNPKAAEVAAQFVEKVRINPGNFVDPVKKFETYNYSEEEYLQELEKIKTRFVPFLDICKKHNTAIRIGVNHGSLSDRIMSRYGDTPEGMVESCMEFLRICVFENFSNVVISIKASSTFVMVQTVRLLADCMEKEGMAFPVHLGVTEAGEGEDGRIKSAVGIGALLIDGIGDTIRVSLSEDPENEIPVARFIRDYIRERENQPYISQEKFDLDRITDKIENIGGSNPPIVIADYSGIQNDFPDPDQIPDFIYVGNKTNYKLREEQKVIIDFDSYLSKGNQYPLYKIQNKATWTKNDEGIQFISLQYSDLNSELIELLHKKPQTVIILGGNSLNRIGEQKAFISHLMIENLKNPVILMEGYSEQDIESFRLKAAVDTGSFFLDKLVQGIFLRNSGTAIKNKDIVSCAFSVLQATGRRITKTEYISCPGCGRTLFDLQKAVKQVKETTSHLKGLKIAVMGCIVNGPGEMADADYGYVGAGNGKVSIYQGKKCIKKNIPEENALFELLELIKKTKK